MRPLLALLLAALFAVPGAAVAGAPPTPVLGPDFTPNPLTTFVKLNNGNESVTERFHGCGTSFTTKAPAYTFTLTKPFTDLRVWVSGPAVLVMPVKGSPYICVKHGVAYYAHWPAGTYKIYLFSPTIGLSAHIRIEMPKRAQAEAQATVAALRTLKLDPASPTNPTFVTLAPTKALRPDLAQIGCGHAPVTPLARLQVSKLSHWVFRAGHRRDIYVIDDKGTCLRGDDNTHARTLKAGTYTLWGQLDEKDAHPKPFEVALADDDRPLMFTGAKTYELGALKGPLVLPSTLQPLKWGAHRRAFCDDIPRTPAFFVHASQDLGPVALKPLRQPGTAPKMFIYGPLEGVKAYSNWPCHDRVHGVIRAQAGKTWAVFLTGDQATKPGAPIYTVALRAGTRPDPMLTPIPIPAKVPLAERSLARQYPFYGRQSMERFFLHAPKQLFVYLTAGADGVPGREPLALAEVKGDRATVARFDGSRHDVPLAALTGDRPAHLTLPRRMPKVPHARDFDEAMHLAGPGEQHLIDAYDRADDKHHACVQRYMEKHDPSWGKDYELIYVRSGKNVSDVWFKRAEGPCHGKALDRKAKRLVGAINRSFKRSLVRYFQALKRRFRH